MKKFSVLLRVIIIALVLTACAPTLQGFVQLPENIRATIAGLFIALFALGFDFAIGRFPWLAFLRAYQQEWALGAAVIFTTWLENLLPTGFEDVSIKGVAFVLALIAAFVPYLIVRKKLAARGVQAFLH